MSEMIQQTALRS